jgi:hypothetical protein
MATRAIAGFAGRSISRNSSSAARRPVSAKSTCG